MGFEIKNGVLKKYSKEKNVTSVVIPEEVTIIGERAFENCENITSITIPNNVTSIEERAFSSCSNLISISIPDSVSNIGERAFERCSNLTSITIPNSVSNIGYSTFSYCVSLTSITIPDSVSDIGDSAFFCCRKLASIIMSDSVSNIRKNAFWGCESLTDITIPNSVTCIEENTFRGCNSLTSIIIPNSVTYIGDSAFEDCENIASISISNSVTCIGDSAFSCCRSLTNIAIPDSVTCIGYSAFSSCSNLTNITIPDSVTSIGRYAFGNCKKLANKEGYVIVNGILFDYLGEESNKITIPDSVTSIGAGVFRGCKSLTDITIPNSVTNIGDGAFAGCSNLTSITIPDSVISIGEYAFSGCTSLANISIPDELHNLGKGAFESCGSIQSIESLGKVKIIRESTFRYCSKLDKIILHEGIEDIRSGAFSECKNLKTISLPNSLQKCAAQAFTNCSSLVQVNMSVETLNNIKSDDIWRLSINSISKQEAEKIDLKKCPPRYQQIIIKLLEENHEEGKKQDKQPKIEDKFNRPEYFKIKENILVSYSGKAERVVVPEGVISIKEDAFKRNKSNIIEIILPQSLQRTGTAFRGLSNMQNIIFTGGELIIDDCAFYGCNSLVNITFPPTVKSIGEYAFRGCSNLEHLRIPDGVCSIGKRAFNYCKYLKSIHIPDSVTRLGSYLFSYSTHIEKYDISGKILKLIDDPEVWYAVAPSLPVDELCYAIAKCPSDLSSFKNDLEEIIKKEYCYCAALYFETQGRMDEYASQHNLSTNEVRDELLSDFGLDENGCKSWKFENLEIVARMEKNFKVTLLDRKGKVLKELPKNKLEPNQANEIKQEIAELRKNITTAVKLRLHLLLIDCLEAREEDVEQWKKGYLTNPILKQIAQLLVWQQGIQTFILNDDGQPIDAEGEKVILGNGKIMLAHPLDIGPKMTEKWQNYLIQNNLKQPFEQMWEPILDEKSIKNDRYDGTTIPLHMLMGKSTHGITLKDGKIFLRQCSVDLVDIIKDETNWAKSEYEIRNFRFDKYTRAVNHIVVLLDKGTVKGRLLKDDLSAMDWMDTFNQAQISEFIRLVTEKGDCPNVTAALLEYKNNKFPDLNTFSEFSLEFI